MKNKTVENNQKACFSGETGIVEIIAFICNTFVLAMFFYDQIVGNLGLWYLIIPFLFIEIYLLLFGLFPEKYIFEDNCLEIHHKFRKTVYIYYDSVFNMDSEIKDTFVNITKSNSVKLYYIENEHKKSALVRPEKTVVFVETIKEHCPIFQCELNGKTDIEKII